MESDVPRMPLVIGMNLAQAQAVISAAIADPQVTIQRSDPGEVPPGMVIGQRPVAGNEVAPGSHIELTVSAEPVRQERKPCGCDRQVVTGTLWRMGGPRGTPTVPLPGQVTARNAAGEEFAAVTASDGRFQLLLPPGTYQVTGTSPQVSSGRKVGRMSGPVDAVLHVTKEPVHDIQIILHIR
jgi:hypothetical protein